MIERLQRVPKGAVGLALLVGGMGQAGAVLVGVSDPSGLSATADFTSLMGGTQLQIVATNTSTGVPTGFSNSDQLLTSVSFNLPAGSTIGGGTAAVGPGSTTVNFDPNGPPPPQDFGEGADISGEYGFGNGGSTGLFPNFVSTNTAGASPFGGANLDGPNALDGPQGGITNGIVPLGGLGAVDNAVTFVVDISGTSLSDLNFVTNDLVTFEFGSDAAFLTTPVPAAVWLFGSGLLGLFGIARRRRS